MSGIFGLFRFDGAPPDPLWIERMNSAMEYYGADGSGSLIEGPIGLGHRLRHLNPEDAFVAQPYRSGPGPLVCAARLDNRDSLLQAFSIPPSEFPRTSDAQLVSLAWSRWGSQLATRLQGDWSLAAWNPREQTLFLARDACGLSALFYYQGNGFLAFASSIQALLAIPGVPGHPEERTLAEILINTCDYADLTAYKGIRRLLGAHTLTVTANGQSRVDSFWSPHYREPIRYRRNQDYEEAFLEHYTRAVQSCLRTQKPIAAALSGGRDSGSVVALAAPLLAAQGRELTAYTSIPCLPPDAASGRRIGNEWDLAHATALMAGPNVRHIPIDAAGYSVLQGIRHFLDFQCGPNGAAVNHFWLQAIAETAALQGAEVLLTGQMGNYSVSWTGNASAALALRQGDWQTALYLLRHAEETPWHTLKRQILKPLLTPALALADAWKSPQPRDLENFSSLNPHFIEKLDPRDTLRKSALASTQSASVIPGYRLFSAFLDIREILLQARYRVSFQLSSEISARHKVRHLDPTANLQLVEFLLRVPDSQFVRDGQFASLFQRAFRGRMPEPVLLGTQKGLQSADIGHRILRELPAFQHCLDEIASIPAAAELLNLPILHRCLQDLVARIDPETSANSAQILLKGITVGLFLQRQARP